MKKFEMPKIQVVKFACNLEAITTSSYMVEIENNGYTGATNNVADILGNANDFLDNL